MFFAPALGVGRRLTLEAWRHCARKCQIRTPPRKGLTTEAGFCARYATRRTLTPRADNQLAEQARNRDHDSSDPCGQTKKQQDIAQEHRHIAPPLYLPCDGLSSKVWPSFDSRLRNHHELFHACFPHAAFPAIFLCGDHRRHRFHRLGLGVARPARVKRPLS